MPTLRVSTGWTLIGNVIHNPVIDYLADLSMPFDITCNMFYADPDGDGVPTSPVLIVIMVTKNGTMKDLTDLSKAIGSTDI